MFAQEHEDGGAMPVAFDEVDARGVTKAEVAILATELIGIGVSGR